MKRAWRLKGLGWHGVDEVIKAVDVQKGAKHIVHCLWKNFKWSSCTGPSDFRTDDNPSCFGSWVHLMKSVTERAGQQGTCFWAGTDWDWCLPICCWKRMVNKANTRSRSFCEDTVCEDWWAPSLAGRKKQSGAFQIQIYWRKSMQSINVMNNESSAGKNCFLNHKVCFCWKLPRKAAICPNEMLRIYVGTRPQVRPGKCV